MEKAFRCKSCKLLKPLNRKTCILIRLATPINYPPGDFDEDIIAICANCFKSIFGDGEL